MPHGRALTKYPYGALDSFTTRTATWRMSLVRAFCGGLDVEEYASSAVEYGDDLEVGVVDRFESFCDD